MIGHCTNTFHGPLFISCLWGEPGKRLYSNPVLIKGAKAAPAYLEYPDVFLCSCLVILFFFFGSLGLQTPLFVRKCFYTSYYDIHI
ncbi:hypothetical protein CROQUDRAFT_315275 [Cronartium quercuum f. sp. fusiforme G11]|uniref:Uncharacterized protein n=1 Tax=Cronartium quercuum f. sp. fusiforme G11 TaxID=708437 RepID=A0A9P6NTY8_9BASI|nr:hypothetical protein CROQUDRAFT_315275 [Cronartium quercuum f. sp. fusiforme G11]